MYHLETELDREVDRILWEEWDPIGVRELVQDRKGADFVGTEYRRYVPWIIELLRNGADSHSVAVELRKYAVGRMGLRPKDPTVAKSESDQRVAELLSAAYAEKG